MTTNQKDLLSAKRVALQQLRQEIEVREKTLTPQREAIAKTLQDHTTFLRPYRNAFNRVKAARNALELQSRSSKDESLEAGTGSETNGTDDGNPTAPPTVIRESRIEDPETMRKRHFLEFAYMAVQANANPEAYRAIAEQVDQASNLGEALARLAWGPVWEKRRSRWESETEELARLTQWESLLQDHVAHMEQSMRALAGYRFWRVREHQGEVAWQAFLESERVALVRQTEAETLALQALQNKPLGRE